MGAPSWYTGPVITVQAGCAKSGAHAAARKRKYLSIGLFRWRGGKLAFGPGFARRSFGHLHIGERSVTGFAGALHGGAGGLILRLQQGVLTFEVRDLEGALGHTELRVGIRRAQIGEGRRRRFRSQVGGEGRR